MVSSDFSQTWTEIPSIQGNGYSAVYVSESGKNMYVLQTTNGVYIYNSNDFGNTWNQNTLLTSNSVQPPTSQLCMSETECYVYIYHYTYTSSIYKSTDFGISWIEVVDTAKIFDFGFGTQITMSSSGKYIAYLGAQSVVISSDYGEFYRRINPQTNYESIEYGTGLADYTTRGKWYDPTVSSGLFLHELGMDYSGKYLTAVVKCPFSIVSTIYTSNDFGITWTQPLISPTIQFECVALSGDGRVQMASGHDIETGLWNIFESLNHGANFNARSDLVSSYGAYGMCLNGDGALCIIGSLNQKTYIL